MAFKVKFPSFSKKLKLPFFLWKTNREKYGETFENLDLQRLSFPQVVFHIMWKMWKTVETEGFKPHFDERFSHFGAGKLLCGLELILDASPAGDFIAGEVS